MSANQKKFYEISMGIITEVKFVHAQYYIQFLLVDNMSHEEIIGTDELFKKEVIIDYEEY